MTSLNTKHHKLFGIHLLNVLYNTKTIKVIQQFAMINSKCMDVTYMVKLASEHWHQGKVINIKKLLQILPRVETVQCKKYSSKVDEVTGNKRIQCTMTKEEISKFNLTTETSDISANLGQYCKLFQFEVIVHQHQFHVEAVRVFEIEYYPIPGQVNRPSDESQNSVTLDNIISVCNSLRWKCYTTCYYKSIDLLKNKLIPFNHFVLTVEFKELKNEDVVKLRKLNTENLFIGIITRYVIEDIDDVTIPILNYDKMIFRNPYTLINDELQLLYPEIYHNYQYIDTFPFKIDALDEIVQRTDSKLLSNAQLKLICVWTKKGNWKLLYRGTRDGFRASDFHQKCDNKGETVVVINSNGNLFGGYTPNSWKSSIQGNVLLITAELHSFSH